MKRNKINYKWNCKTKGNKAATIVADNEELNDTIQFDESVKNMTNTNKIKAAKTQRLNKIKHGATWKEVD